MCTFHVSTGNMLFLQVVLDPFFNDYMFLNVCVVFFNNNK